MTFTLTVDPDEITGDDWTPTATTRLEVRPRTVNGQPFPGTDGRIIRPDSWVEDDTQGGHYTVTLLSAEVQPYGYEARIGSRMDWVVVPATAAGQTVNLGSLMTAPVTPLPFPSATALLASLQQQVAELVDRVAELEAAAVPVADTDGLYAITGTPDSDGLYPAHGTPDADGLYLIGA